jgi:hypothetical protein
MVSFYSLWTAHEKRGCQRVSQRRTGRDHGDQGAAFHRPAAARIDDVPEAAAVVLEPLLADPADPQRFAG